MSRLVKSARKWFKKTSMLNQTRRELSHLSDRELADIGISRCDIGRVAREASLKAA